MIERAKTCSEEGIKTTKANVLYVTGSIVIGSIKEKPVDNNVRFKLLYSEETKKVICI